MAPPELLKNPIAAVAVLATKLHEVKIMVPAL
jgi:hypothetical protein